MGLGALFYFQIKRNTKQTRAKALGWISAAQEVRREADSLSERQEQKRDAGTGYGREEYSPSVAVAFEPEAYAYEKTFIKYEWRETLYRLGVLRTQPHQVPRNRLWDDFAPPPPRN